jgi:hypothetical protein
MTLWPTRRSALLLSVSILLAGCGAENAPTSPSLSASSVGAGAAVAAARPASRCVNVSAEGVADLNIIVIGDHTGLGALPFTVTIGDVPGKMYSVITEITPSGQGSTHYTLQHRFDSTDSTRPGSFATEDRAVCAIAGSDPNICRVNDVLQVVSGSGVFENAGGFLTNHGTIDLTDFVPFVRNGRVTINLGGRVCGDGLGTR